MRLQFSFRQIFTQLVSVSIFYEHFEASEVVKVLPLPTLNSRFLFWKTCDFLCRDYFGSMCPNICADGSVLQDKQV